MSQSFMSFAAQYTGIIIMCVATTAPLFSNVVGFASAGSVPFNSSFFNCTSFAGAGVWTDASSASATRTLQLSSTHQHVLGSGASRCQYKDMEISWFPNTVARVIRNLTKMTPSTPQPSRTMPILLQARNVSFTATVLVVDFTQDAFVVQDSSDTSRYRIKTDEEYSLQTTTPVRVEISSCRFEGGLRLSTGGLSVRGIAPLGVEISITSSHFEDVMLGSEMLAGFRSFVLFSAFWLSQSLDMSVITLDNGGVTSVTAAQAAAFKAPSMAQISMEDNVFMSATTLSFTTRMGMIALLNCRAGNGSSVWISGSEGTQYYSQDVWLSSEFDIVWGFLILWSTKLIGSAGFDFQSNDVKMMMDAPGDSVNLIMMWSAALFNGVVISGPESYVSLEQNVFNMEVSELCYSTMLWTMMPYAINIQSTTVDDYASIIVERNVANLSSAVVEDVQHAVGFLFIVSVDVGLSTATAPSGISPQQSIIVRRNTISAFRRLFKGGFGIVFFADTISLGPRGYFSIYENTVTEYSYGIVDHSTFHFYLVDVACAGSGTGIYIGGNTIQTFFSRRNNSVTVVLFTSSVSLGSGTHWAIEQNTFESRSAALSDIETQFPSNEAIDDGTYPSTYVQYSSLLSQNGFFGISIEASSRYQTPETATLRIERNRIMFSLHSLYSDRNNVTLLESTAEARFLNNSLAFLSNDSFTSDALNGLASVEPLSTAALAAMTPSSVRIFGAFGIVFGVNVGFVTGGRVYIVNNTILLLIHQSGGSAMAVAHVTNVFHDGTASTSVFSNIYTASIAFNNFSTIIVGPPTMNRFEAQAAVLNQLPQSGNSASSMALTASILQQKYHSVASDFKILNASYGYRERDYHNQVSLRLHPCIRFRRHFLSVHSVGFSANLGISNNHFELRFDDGNGGSVGREEDSDKGWGPSAPALTTRRIRLPSEDVTRWRMPYSDGSRRENYPLYAGIVLYQVQFSGANAEIVGNHMRTFFGDVAAVVDNTISTVSPSSAVELILGNVRWARDLSSSSTTATTSSPSDLSLRLHRVLLLYTKNIALSRGAIFIVMNSYHCHGAFVGSGERVLQKLASADRENGSGGDFAFAAAIALSSASLVLMESTAAYAAGGLVLLNNTLELQGGLQTPRNTSSLSNVSILVSATINLRTAMAVIASGSIEGGEHAVVNVPRSLEDVRYASAETLASETASACAASDSSFVKVGFASSFSPRFLFTAIMSFAAPSAIAFSQLAVAEGGGVSLQDNFIIGTGNFSAFALYEGSASRLPESVVGGGGVPSAEVPFTSMPPLEPLSSASLGGLPHSKRRGKVIPLFHYGSIVLLTGSVANRDLAFYDNNADHMNALGASVYFGNAYFVVDYLGSGVAEGGRYAPAALDGTRSPPAAHVFDTLSDTLLSMALEANASSLPSADGDEGAVLAQGGFFHVDSVVMIAPEVHHPRSSADDGDDVALLRCNMTLLASEFEVYGGRVLASTSDYFTAAAADNAASFRFRPTQRSTVFTPLRMTGAYTKVALVDRSPAAVYDDGGTILVTDWRMDEALASGLGAHVSGSVTNQSFIISARPLSMVGMIIENGARLIVSNSSSVTVRNTTRRVTVAARRFSAVAVNPQPLPTAALLPSSCASSSLSFSPNASHVSHFGVMVVGPNSSLRVERGGAFTLGHSAASVVPMVMVNSPTPTGRSASSLYSVSLFRVFAAMHVQLRALHSAAVGAESSLRLTTDPTAQPSAGEAGGNALANLPQLTDGSAVLEPWQMSQFSSSTLIASAPPILLQVSPFALLWAAAEAEVVSAPIAVGGGSSAADLSREARSAPYDSGFRVVDTTLLVPVSANATVSLRYPLISLHNSHKNPNAAAASARSTAEVFMDPSAASLRGSFYVCNNRVSGIPLLYSEEGISDSVRRAAVETTVRRSVDSDSAGGAAEGHLHIDELCGAKTVSESVGTMSSSRSVFSSNSEPVSQSRSTVHSGSISESDTPSATDSPQRTITISIITISIGQTITHSAAQSASPQRTPSPSGPTPSRSPTPVPDVVPPLKYREERLDSERGASVAAIAGGGLIAPRSGGQASVAMAVLRMAEQCRDDGDGDSNNGYSRNTLLGGGGEGDNDGDNLDEPLSAFIHPLAFGVGSGPFRYLIGAVIGNCLVIPAAAVLIVRFPLTYALGRWGLPGEPSAEDVQHFLGWPSILLVPLSVLAEGSMTAVVELLRSGGAAESVVGIAGGAVLFGALGTWAYVVFCVLGRMPIVLRRVPFGGYACWPITPLWERCPADEGEAQKDGSGAEIAAADVEAVESALEQHAHLFGDGVALWAEWLCVVCSLIVGGLEGAGGTIPCRESTPVLLAFALLQSALSCMTMVPSEAVVQVLTAVLLTLLSVNAVMEAYADDSSGGDSGGFLSLDAQDLIGLIINVLSFFGMVLGVAIALAKLLERRAQMLMALAMGVRLPQRVSRSWGRSLLQRFSPPSDDGDGGSSLTTLFMPSPSAVADIELKSLPMLDVHGLERRGSRHGGDTMDAFLGDIERSVRRRQSQKARRDQAMATGQRRTIGIGEAVAVVEMPEINADDI